MRRVPSITIVMRCAGNSSASAIAALEATMHKLVFSGHVVNGIGRHNELIIPGRIRAVAIGSRRSGDLYVAECWCKAAPA